MVVGDLLDLDGAARGQRRGAGHGRDLAGGRAAHGDTSTGQCAAAAGGCATRGRTATADAEHLGHQRRGAADAGREGGEGGAHAAQRLAVLAAAGALAHVPAGAPGGLDAAVIGGHEVLADDGAVGRARLGGLDEAEPRAHQQRLDGRDRHVERGGEVGVGHAVDLAHQQRRALLVGQAPDVGHEAAQVLTARGVLERVVQRRARHLEHVGRGGHGAAQVVDAAVVGDAVEPGAHVDRPRVGPQRPERAHEDVLQHVLGVLARPRREHLADVGEQPLAVAVVEDVERLVRAGPEQREQLVVRPQSQQWKRDREAG